MCVEGFKFSSVQSLSRVWLFVQHARLLSITISCSLLKLMSIESVMPSNHLILYRLLLLLPSIFPSIRVFSNESVLCIRWPKYWSFSFSISPSSEYSVGENKESLILVLVKLHQIELWWSESYDYSNMINMIFG